MYMFDWLTGPSAEQNRQNVKDLARHLNTLKRRKSSSFSPSPLSKRRKKRQSSSSSSSSSRKSKKRTRKLEAQLGELHQILAGLPRHSTLKLMIQQELQAKTQTETDVLGKLAAMADSLKAQKEASEAQMAALKLEIKAKQEQGENVEKETKELKAVMVEQVKTDATINRIEKYGGVVAQGLNTTGAMAANVGVALKGATYGVGDVAKSLGVNALGAAQGIGNAAKAVGSTALGALYGLGNAAKDVHTNKEVVDYYAKGAKFAAKTGVLGAAPFVVGHVVDNTLGGVKKLISDVKGAVNADVGKMQAELIRDAPSIQERQAATSGLVATANKQKKVLKANAADPQARNVEAMLTKGAVQAKEDLKQSKELGLLPVSAPSDDAHVLALLSAFKMSDPVTDFQKIMTGFKLRPKTVREQIVAKAKAYMRHLTSEINRLRAIVISTQVPSFNVDKYHAAEKLVLEETAAEKDAGMAGMEARFTKMAILLEFVATIPQYMARSPAKAASTVKPEALAVGPDTVAELNRLDERAVEAAAVQAGELARASPSKLPTAADAAEAALDALEAAKNTSGAAAEDALAAAESAATAAAAGAAKAAKLAEQKAKRSERALKQLQGTAGFVAAQTKRKSVKFVGK